MMINLDDYEVLEETPDLPSAFLVKHRQSEQLFQVQSVSLTTVSDKDRKALMKKIKTRVNLIHPHALQFYEPIQHRDVLYLKQEYVPFGNLQKFTQNLRRNLHETFLYRILYQTAFALKTIKCLMGPLSLKTILLDENYQVKLYNFSTDDQNGKQKDIKMSQLGALIFELATSKRCSKPTFEMELQQENYSESFKTLVASMIKDHSEIGKHIDKILCHPQVLLQSRKWSKDCCFMENGNNVGPDRLTALKRREAALHLKEELLKEQERLLVEREQKVQRMEKYLEDKLQQADAYLKRCKSASSKSSLTSCKSKNICEEASYASCGDSDDFPTSTKLHVEKIVKPTGFSRTLSERRIRFKTSPLKDRNFVRRQDRKSMKQSRIIEEQAGKCNNQKTNISRRRSLFVVNDYENSGVPLNRQTSCKVSKVGWTQEAKKQAFQMLKMLNGEEKENISVKRTVL